MPTDLAETAPPEPRLRAGEAFAKRVLIAVSVTIAVVLLVLLVGYAVEVLLLIFAGVLVAVLLRGLADLLQRHSRFSAAWSLAIVIVFLLLLFGAIGYFVFPRVFDQLDDLYRTIPKALGEARAFIGKYPLGKRLLKYWPGWSVVSGQVSGTHSNLLARMTGIASTTLGIVVTVVLILVLGLYLAAEPELYVSGMLHLIPKAYRDHARKTMYAIAHALRGWLVGQGIDMACIGILTGTGLWFIGVPLSFALGLLAALANFIPNFGPIISFTPSALLALTVGPSKVLWVLILFLIVQGLEGYFLAPTIQRRTISLPPALTILAQVLLGLLLGPMGVIFATPLMAMFIVLIKVLYVRDMLGDAIPVAEAPPVPHPSAG